MFQGLTREERIKSMFSTLDNLQQDTRATEALAFAAAAVEYAAYELAQSTEAKRVAQLILFAADLDRVVQSMRAADGTADRMS
ncbi:hypothetical protein [Tateyamaria sp. SN6-1]|uniref:hypothetical protein n=1 Tax=Tateyamaria sp. SN6-1 TaxID=3092148 RepID=UPI0039F56A68